MTKQRIILIVCLLFSLFAEAQTSHNDSDMLPPDTVRNDTIPNRDGTPVPLLLPSAPASPQATAFQKAGEYTVNNASGIPDIAIPLYELDHHGYKIPITLRYLPTPLKPGYNYDVTGHGWSLNLGSCVSRTIESWPDEIHDFELYIAPIDHPLSLSLDKNRVAEILNQCDLGRDRFNVTLPNGDAFSFCIVNSGGHYYITEAEDSYKVDFALTEIGAYNHITSFTLTDNYGVQYLFDTIEKSITQSVQTNGWEVAWYLSRITIPNVSSPIVFTYGQNINQQNGHGATEPLLIMKRLWGQNGSDDVLSFNYQQQDTWTHYQSKLLTKISFGTTQADFTYTNQNETTTYNNLANISIKDNQTEVRKCSFIYDYQYPSGTLALLTKLTITGRQGTTDKLVYRFFNHPALAVYGTDHWGYGNSNTNNLSEIANMNFYTEYYAIDLSTMPSILGLPVTPLSLNQGDYSYQQKAKLMTSATGPDPRQPATPETHGILSYIIYPTGGKTVFVFENHRYVTATDDNGDYIDTKRNRRIAVGGGFRIRSITNYTSDGQVSDVKEYRYGPTNREIQTNNLNMPTISGAGLDEHVGYGEPVVDPTILTYTQIKASDEVKNKISTMLKGGNHGSLFSPAGQYGSGKNGYQCSFSPLNFRSLLQGRAPVVYSQITEYHGQMGDVVAPQNTTGKTVCKFQIYDDTGATPDSVYNVPLRYDENILLVEGSVYKKDYLTPKTDYTFYYYMGQYYPTLLQEETYAYLLNHHTATNYILKNNFDYDWFRYYELHGNGYETFTINYVINPVSVGKYRMTQKQVTRDGTTTTENTTYNGNGMVATQSFTGAKPHTTTFTYPVNGHSSIETELCNRHMYGTVLKSQTKAYGSSTRDVSAYTVDYDYFDANHNLLLPSKLNRLSVVNGVAGNFEEDVHVLSYSSNGNPTEAVDRTGIHTVYVWGYDDRYLIAEIKNADLTTVNAALSALSGDVNALRTYPSMANAMVTTWSYQPLVGVTSQTDPSGMSTYYDYDGLGRLKEVYRYEGNVVSTANKRILNQYNYHTITE